jgi:hypothetical protein
MPLLRHATLRKLLPAIRREGLRVAKSKGKLPACWLHSRARTGWACLHTVRRHGGRIESVVVLEVDVPRSWLRRSQPGLWYTLRDVPACRIAARTLDFAAVASSPVRD